MLDEQGREARRRLVLSRSQTGMWAPRAGGSVSRSASGSAHPGLPCRVWHSEQQPVQSLSCGAEMALDPLCSDCGGESYGAWPGNPL